MRSPFGLLLCVGGPMGGVWFWLVSIGSPVLVADAADDGRIGMLFARCWLNPWELFMKGLLFNGSPTDAIESDGALNCNVLDESRRLSSVPTLAIVT
jgi:hypothetical protein